MKPNLKELFDRHRIDKETALFTYDQFCAAVSDLVPKWRDNIQLREQYLAEERKSIIPEFAGESFTDDYVLWLESQLLKSHD